MCRATKSSGVATFGTLYGIYRDRSTGSADNADDCPDHAMPRPGHRSTRPDTQRSQSSRRFAQVITHVLSRIIGGSSIAGPVMARAVSSCPQIEKCHADHSRESDSAKLRSRTQGSNEWEASDGLPSSPQ